MAPRKAPEGAPGVAEGTEGPDVPTEAAKPAVVLAEGDALAAEAGYRAGIDISLYELADRFEADGYDWRACLSACGYSDEQIAVEVDDIA